MKDNIQEYKFDAFISYCHQPLDQAVAEKLEDLLENFRISKKSKKMVVFRDKHELKAGNDLHRDIKDALLQSRYLITVLSENTKESPWCREEIRLFKEAHGNSTKNILTLLVSGDPIGVLPELLRWEMQPSASHEGQAVSYEKKDVVPLSADVRAKTRRQSLHILRIEFLKIAAAILECGFDDLYQRQQRRRRKRIARISAGAIVLLSLVLLVVSIFAYRTWVSENDYRNILAGNYAQEGSQYADSGNAQEALLYYTKALSLEPNMRSAAAGAALLLQEYDWPVQKEGLSGCLKNKRFLPVPLVQAGDPGTGCYLQQSSVGRVVDEEGSQLAELGEDYSDFLGDSAGWWTFRGERSLLFYNPQTGQQRSIPWPEEASPGYAADSIVDFGPDARALEEDRAIVAYKGIVHIYKFDAQGAAVEEMQADLGNALTKDAERQGLSSTNELFLSDDNSLVFVSSLSNAALYSTKDLMLKTTVVQYTDFLTGMDISPQNDYFVITYGSDYRASHINPGGHFEVYSANGTLLYSSPQNGKEAVMGAAFYPDDPEYLLVWGENFVRIYNWIEGRETAAPIKTERIRSACFDKETKGNVLIDHDGKTVSSYTLERMLPADAALAEGEGELPVIISQYLADAECPDGKKLTVSVSKLTLSDSEGNELDTVSLPVMGQRVALSGDSKYAYLYNIDYPALMCVPVDLKAGKLGEVRQIDTGNEAATGIWFGDGWLAAETRSRNLLLFDGEGQQVCRIMPEYTGNVISVLVDSSIRYAALIMEMDIHTQAQDSNYSTNGAVEIWDTVSGLRLAGFEKEGHKIEKAGITADDALVWRVDGKEYIRHLAVPVPDAGSLAFLHGLCCLDLDEGQEVVYRQPVDSGLQMGSWSALANGWETGQILFGQEEQEHADSGQTLQELTKELAEAEDFGESAWFDRCNDIWQQLSESKIVFSELDMDRFYHVYRRGAEEVDTAEQIAFGLETYIQLTLEFGKKSSEDSQEETTMTDFDKQIMQTLAYTKEYDGIIIQALRDITASLMADAAEEAEGSDYADDFLAENDAILHAYTIQYFQTLLQALEGNGKEAMDALAAYCAADPQLAVVAREADVFAGLYAGDAGQAAKAVNEWLGDFYKVTADIDYTGEILKNHLVLAEALVWREQIDASVFDEYIRQIHADIGMEVMEVSAEAQKAGLRIGDLIISIDGSRFGDMCHYRRLIENAGEGYMLEILRNGKAIYLQRTVPFEFMGKMAVRYTN